MVGDSWGTVSLPTLTGAGLEFVFVIFTGILVTSEWSLPLLILRGWGQARGPQFPPPQCFAQSRQSNTGGTEQGSESLEGQMKMCLYGTPRGVVLGLWLPSLLSRKLCKSSEL